MLCELLTFVHLEAKQGTFHCSVLHIASISVNYTLHTGPVYMQANQHLGKLATSHNGVLITQIAKRTCPTLMNWSGGKGVGEPLNGE